MKRRVVSLLICLLVVASTITTITENAEQPQNIGQSTLSSSGSGGLADSPWPMFRQNLRHTGQSPYDTSGNNGQLKWSFTTGGIVFSSPAIDSDGTIYIGSYDSKIYALNPDGTEKWNFTTGDRVKSSPAIGSDGTIYVGSLDNFLYALNSDGTEKWNFLTSNMISSSPAIVSDGTIYVGSSDIHLYAINQDGKEKWNFVGSSNMDSSPAIGLDGSIYVGAWGHVFFAIDPNGTEKWRYENTSHIVSSPAISLDGTIYVGDWSGILYAFNPNGTQKWKFDTGYLAISSSPAIGSDGTIYVGSRNNKLYAINPDGTEKWNFTTGDSILSSPAIGSDGTIYIGSDDHKLYAINPDGSEKWSFTTSDWVRSSPAIGADGTVYVGSYDGNLYAIGESSQNQPPIAKAGPDQTVNEADTVHFDGSASYDPDGNQEEWSFKADNPSPTWGCAAAALNDEIYYMGGIPCYPIVNPSSVFMKFNPVTDTWLSLPDLPVPRAYLGAAAVCGKVYAIGGSDGSNSTDTVFEFDPITNNWISKSPMPTPMEAFGIATVKDRIYVIGGISTLLSGTPCESVFEYDYANDSWITKPDMPFIRAHLACAVLEDKIYAIGGDMYGSTGAVEMYDPVSETWTSKASLNNGRAGLSAEVLQGKIYAFGGTGKWGLAGNVNEMYDPATDNWTLKPSMLESRVYFGSGVVGNCIYAMGGSYGPLIVAVPNSTEQYCVGGGLAYEWDFDAGVDSDVDGDPTNDVDATGPTPTHVYGDDGVYIVTLWVTDIDNLSATDTCNITVQNVDPTVTMESVTMDVEIGLRVAGRKYNDVGMTLYENGTPIGYISIERLPGSPDEQMTWIPLSVDFSKSYTATVTYTPEDPPNVGGNPVWIYIKSHNGSIKKIHHTFNVQQSKKRDSNHWNHVDPWEVDLSGHFVGLPFEITSHITDPGSDDELLTYTYGSQIVNITYLNNPPDTDPYPSPEINPVDIIDTTTLVCEGPGTVILVVKDDDNVRLGVGEGTDFKSVVLRT